MWSILLRRHFFLTTFYGLYFLTHTVKQLTMGLYHTLVIFLMQHDVIQVEQKNTTCRKKIKHKYTTEPV